MSAQPNEPVNEAARLSRLLFLAQDLLTGVHRELVTRFGVTYTAAHDVAEEIGEYRAEQGWSPDGYGGERDRPYRGRPRKLIDLTRAEALLEQMPIMTAAAQLGVSGRTLERRMEEHPALRAAARRYWARRYGHTDA